MAIAASSVTPTNSLEDFRIEFNNLVSDVSGITATNKFTENIIFEGATADAYETTLTVTDPTADRTITIPNATGTLLTSSSANPASSDGSALGSTSLEWSDLYLADGGIIYFGDDQDITLTHAADTSLTVGGAGGTTGMIINNTATDGDPFLAFSLSGTQTFTMGVDDGDSDKFKIGTTAIGTSTAFSMDSSGNVAITGDLTVTGDDITMGTNTSGAALIADGTNFNPVVISGDISIATNGTAAIGSGVIVEADIANDAVTLAKMASGTDGNIISYDASGNPVAIATGNDGQVLTSTGAGSPPAFEDAAGGGLIFIQTVVASGDSTITLSGIDATYDSYFIAYSDVDSGTNSAHFRVRFGDSGGIDSGGSDYSWGILQKKTDNTTVTGRNDENDDHIELMDSTGADGTEGVSGLMKLHAPGDASHNITATFDTAADLGDGFYGNWTVGRRNTNIAITQVQFYFDSTTVSTGRFTLWGLKHS